MGSPLRILDFDLENRPLNYVGADFTHGDVTVIAWSWVGEDEVFCKAQTKDDRSRATMMRAFRKAYEQADMVTGHFIRSHDLPTINGALIELGLPALTPKLSCDTKSDLVKRKNLPVSQEALCDMLDIPEPKIQMPQAKWRDSNRLTKRGIERAMARAIGDVMQHKPLRLELVKRDLLAPPRMWRPASPRTHF